YGSHHPSNGPRSRPRHSYPDIERLEKPAYYELLSRPSGHNRSRPVRRFWTTALDHRDLRLRLVHSEQAVARAEYSRRAGCAGEAGSLCRTRSNAASTRRRVNRRAAAGCRRESSPFGHRVPSVGKGPIRTCGGCVYHTAHRIALRSRPGGPRPAYRSGKRASRTVGLLPRPSLRPMTRTGDRLTPEITREVCQRADGPGLPRESSSAVRSDR